MPLALMLAALAAFDDTPAKTVQAFIDALNAKDGAGLARRVVDGKPGLSLPPGFPGAKATLGTVKEDGDEATVEVEVTLNGERPPQTYRETVHLRRADGDWRIVPVKGPSSGPPPVLGLIAFMVNHPEEMTRARTAATTTACLSNVKQLATATMIYLSDHDDVLPKDASRWKAAIMPYVRSEAIFHCPDDRSGGVSYFLDPRVAGRSVASLPNPAGTAMIVEGTPKKTAFRHRGRANVGYIDGHARIATPEVMRQARTTPLK